MVDVEEGEVVAEQGELSHHPGRVSVRQRTRSVHEVEEVLELGVVLGDEAPLRASASQ